MDDTISRQAAIDALDEYIEEYSYDLDENGYHNPKWCAMQEAKMTIQRLPSAERRGRWADHSDEWRYNMIIISLIELDKMPKDCDYCPLNYDDMYCTAVKLPKGSGIRYDGKRPDWCPLIDITKPAMEHMKHLTELFAKTVVKLKEVNHDEE